MTTEPGTVVICGAGIAGVAAAYFLAVEHGCRDVVLVEAGNPLSLTSDKSTEAYRNWWPGPDQTMTEFMNRSIDLIESFAAAEPDRIGMNRNGYLFASADSGKSQWLKDAATSAARHGGGPVRVHDSPDSDYQRHITVNDSLTGADIITNKALIEHHFPYLNPEISVVAHARRAGWLSAQQLGMVMLEAARENGVRLLRGEMSEIDSSDGQVKAVVVNKPDGESVRLNTERLILSAGPMLKPMAAKMGIDLPIVAERHMKISVNDGDGLVPRNAPMLIWLDEVQLPWTRDERDALSDDPNNQWLFETFPAGVHCRPHGVGQSQSLLGLFTYDNDPAQVILPLPDDPHYPDIVLRGLSRMIPGLERYLRHGQRPFMDGGYYIRTQENRPLIGALPVHGAYVSGAYSGFGIMASCAGGDLIARHVTGAPLPDYAPAFDLNRYQDPAFVDLLSRWGEDGQL